MRIALLTAEAGLEDETRERAWLLVRLLMGVCLLACLMWLVICLLLTPIMMCMRRREM
jgi:hypothetical protein